MPVSRKDPNLERNSRVSPAGLLALSIRSYALNARRAIPRQPRANPVLVGLCLLLLSPSINQPAAAADEPDGQRRLFVTAEQALRQGDRPRYEALKSALADYPLYPYLQHQELTKDWSRVSQTQVEGFLRRYQDTPLAPFVRRAWLARLAEKGQWQAFLDAYRPDKSVERRCQYLTALLQTGHEQQALEKVVPIWLSGTSQPKACDPVFAEWIRQGHLTEGLVWRRIELAMERSDTALAGYLQRYLTGAEQAWARLWLDVHDDPGLLRDRARFASPHPERSRILVHGLKRLASRDPTAAARIWQELRTEGLISEPEICEGDRVVAFALARGQAEAALSKLDGLDPCLDSPRQREERIRLALGMRDWDRLRRWIEALPHPEQQEEVWLYWRGRALQEQGDRQAAQVVFGRLAGERSYFGFLAADQTHQPYHLGHQPLAVDPETERRIQSLPGAQRAKELLALGRNALARQEWGRLTAGLDDPELQAAAQIAHRWGWHDQAIFTLARTGYWDDLELRFPLEHAPVVAEQAERRGLDPSWIFAVLRQESAFAADARSPAGAIGLMQLMPATADEVAREVGLGRMDATSLRQPTVNIALGSAYLGKMLRRLDQNPVLATAAYNAGPGRVERWLPEESLEADLWVETLPFRETRKYVQRVLAYLVIYRYRLGQAPMALAELMSPIGGGDRLAGTGGTKNKGAPPPG